MRPFKLVKQAGDCERTLGWDYPMTAVGDSGRLSLRSSVSEGLRP